MWTILQQRMRGCVLSLHEAIVDNRKGEDTRFAASQLAPSFYTRRRAMNIEPRDDSHAATEPHNICRSSIPHHITADNITTSVRTLQNTVLERTYAGALRHSRHAHGTFQDLCRVTALTILRVQIIVPEESLTHILTSTSSLRSRSAAKCHTQPISLYSTPSPQQ